MWGLSEWAKGHNIQHGFQWSGYKMTWNSITVPLFSTCAFVYHANYSGTWLFVFLSIAYFLYIILFEEKYTFWFLSLFDKLACFFFLFSEIYIISFLPIHSMPSVFVCRFLALFASYCSLGRLFWWMKLDFSISRAMMFAKHFSTNKNAYYLCVWRMEW